MANTELLLKIVDYSEVVQQTRELASGPIPYSTHDLALSVAMHFFKLPNYMAALSSAQMLARVKMLEWLQAGLVAPLLVKGFEDVLYRLYKPRKPTAYDLIRNLVKARIRRSPTIGLSPEMVDSVEDAQLLGIPEGTIVAVTKTFFELLQDGLSCEEALDKIEEHRNTFCEGVPKDLILHNDLYAYLFYRICIENDAEHHLATDFIYFATRQTCDFFGFDHERCSTRK